MSLSGFRIDAYEAVHPFNPPIARHHERRVANDEHLQRRALARVSLGDATDVLLHRLGIGVDVEGDGLW
jgi:hypothetical protein